MKKHVLTIFAWTLTVPLCSQIQPLNRHEEPFVFDSGPLVNHSQSRQVVFSETVSVAGAVWLRLFFSHAELGMEPEGGKPTLLRITSAKDGHYQILDRVSLVQWRYSSAYFNGEELLLEVIADPGSAPSVLQMSTIGVGDRGNNNQESICGPLDDRTLSNDPRAARISPVGCTGWLINDQNNCFLSAGHCVGDSFDIIEFNVPLSNPDGSTNHPSPADQYPIDQASLQFDVTVIGNDWAYFGSFPNSNTGLTPFEAQGATYILGDPPAVANNETINITGYGTTDGQQGTPLEWSQVQKVHTGPLVNVSGTVLQYAVDTTGGNSGSAILNEDTGEAIGIHTNAGCSAGGGANNGTSTANAGLINALANPIGVCALGPPPLAISLPNGIPELISPDGTTIQVQIDEINGGVLQPGTAKMVYNNGMGDVDLPLSSVEGNLFEAVLPPLNCPSDLTFYFSAESTGARTIVEPFYAPNQRIYRKVAGDYEQSFRDDFQTDMGWTVENDPNLTDGAWERGIPAGYGLRADPPWDADSSGQCFLTDNIAGNSDVDGGNTVLVSPIMDASIGGDPHITFWRWWSDEGSQTMDDTFLIEVSDDGGATWTTLETVGPNVVGSWVFRSFRIADFVTPNNQFRIRFDASDLGAGSIIEAGVDGVAIYNDATGFSCGAPCPFDLNNDDVIDGNDTDLAVSYWGDDNQSFDFNADTFSDVLDIVLLLDAFGACP